MAAPPATAMGAAPATAMAAPQATPITPHVTATAPSTEPEVAFQPTEELPPVVLPAEAPVTEEIDVTPFVPYVAGVAGMAGNGHANGNGNGNGHGHDHGNGALHDLEVPLFGEESVSFVNAPFHGPMSLNSEEPSPTASVFFDSDGHVDPDPQPTPRWHLPLHDDDEDDLLPPEWIGPLAARNGDSADEPEPEPAGGSR
jgi:hypothetical protein